MVAASKLRRAQERVISARPFAHEARRVLAHIASRVEETAHPLLAQRPGAASGPTLVIAIAADRGLCGSFNTNVVKAVAQFVRDSPGRPVELGLVGRKSRDMLGRRGFPVRFEHVNLPRVIHFAEAEAIARPAIDDFIEGRVDSVHLVYNEFKSIIQQRVVIEQLLPLPAIEAESEGDGTTAASARVDYLYEPSPQRIFEGLLEQLVLAQVLRALVESTAAFYAAQMTAMDAATRNSAEMLDSLTLYMNKIRQAAITREIIEVVSGAGAL